MEMLGNSILACWASEQNGLAMPYGNIKEEGVTGHVLGGHDDVRKASPSWDLCLSQGTLPGHPAPVCFAQRPIIYAMLRGKRLAYKLWRILNSTISYFMLQVLSSLSILYLLPERSRC